MNWEHFKAFLWLRWRLIANRNRRAGTGSVILQILLTIIMVGGAFLAFAGGVVAGALAMPKASAGTFMLVWDGLVVAFLFFWIGELLAELQRSELLSLEKFLHLPVSLSGAFLINYVGSLSGFATIVFLPLMTGLSIGLVLSKGLGMLVMFPLLLGFWLMVTALAHQFRGWLASIIVNQRRRRTVITLTTFLFVLVLQLPNILAFTSRSGRGRAGTAATEANNKAIALLDRELAQKQISAEEYERRVTPLRPPNREQRQQSLLETVTLANKVIPLGWLPLGAVAGFEGQAGLALLAAGGLALIGTASLRRSYRTTLRLYTGQYSAQSTPVAAPTPSTPPPTARTRGTGSYAAALLEKRIPFISEYAAAITVAGFRGLTRAPEAKFMLLSPLVMVFVFGSSLLRQRTEPAELLRPLMAAGGFTFMLFMLVGMIGNQFAFDRSGFRVFVLSPAPRRDILLGKNLATAPFGIGFMLLAALVMQVAYPMRVDHYLALLLQMIPMYLMYCLVGNVLSILAPMPVAAGSMKPVKPKAMAILVHFAFVFVFPLAMAPTLIPLGIEYLLVRSGITWIPAYLLLTIVEGSAVIWIYLWFLNGQGSLLQRREQKILETVTSKME